MRDLMTKLKLLLNMKSALVEALRQDLERAVRIIQLRDEEIRRLCSEVTELQQRWWQEQDSNNAWVEDQLKRIEEEERHAMEIDVILDNRESVYEHELEELERMNRDFDDDEIPF